MQKSEQRCAARENFGGGGADRIEKRQGKKIGKMIFAGERIIAKRA